jgi:hypothetical protein
MPGKVYIYWTRNCFFFKNFFIVAILFTIFLITFFELSLKTNQLLHYKTKDFPVLSQNANDEWEILNNNLFIRVKTAFYFIEKTKIVIFITCLDDAFGENLNYMKFAFNIKLYEKGNRQHKFAEFFVQNIQIAAFSRKKPYQTNAQLEATFDLTLLKESQHIDFFNKIEMVLGIIAIDKRNNNFSSTNPDSINVKIKYRFSEKRNIYFCAENPIYLEDNNHVDLKWFIELNRLIGFDRFILSNNSVPNTNEFNKIFEKNKDFLEVVQYNYLPNFLQPNSSQKFVRHYEDLTKKGVEFFGDALQYTIPMDTMSYTECIHNNIDKANLIFVGDIDETFIPSRLSTFDTKQKSIEFLSSLNLKNEIEVLKFKREFLNEEQCLKTNKIRSYMDDIYRNSNISNELSVYFLQVTFLRDDLSEEIFSQLDSILINSTRNYPIKFKVFKKHVPTKTKNFVFADSSYDANFMISINDEFQFKYAQSLLNVYKFVIKPFLKENEYHLKKESERLSRFLHMDMLGYGAGKTFLNTKTAQFMQNAHV